MKYDEFISQVEQRTGLASREEAERATQAALETLAERLVGGGAKDLASQLPAELAQYLQQGDTSVKTPFLLDEFFWRVSQREGVDLNESTLHARVVIALLSEVCDHGRDRERESPTAGGFRQVIRGRERGQSARGRRTVRVGRVGMESHMTVVAAR